jgi:hypothetical protein
MYKPLRVIDRFQVGHSPGSPFWYLRPCTTKLIDENCTTHHGDHDTLLQQ